MARRRGKPAGLNFGADGAMLVFAHAKVMRLAILRQPGHERDAKCQLAPDGM
jgi:hypothetical protein